MNFEEAFEALIGHEGGYVNSPADPGGETKFGISKRSHPYEDIKALTIERAKAIYLHEYWGPAACDALPDYIRYLVFTVAVMAGPRRAATMLQEVVGETQDGIVGPRTLQATQSMPAARLVSRFGGEFLEFLAGLPHWPAFGRGWARRLASILKEA